MLVPINTPVYHLKLQTIINIVIRYGRKTESWRYPLYVSNFTYLNVGIVDITCAWFISRHSKQTLVVLYKRNRRLSHKCTICQTNYTYIIKVLPPVATTRITYDFLATRRSNFRVEMCYFVLFCFLYVWPNHSKQSIGKCLLRSKWR